VLPLIQYPSSGRDHRSFEEVPTLAVVLGLDSDKRDDAVRGIKALLLGIVRAMLSDRISTLDGYTAISALSWTFVSEAESAAYSTFDGVANEIEDLPTPTLANYGRPQPWLVKTRKPLNTKVTSRRR